MQRTLSALSALLLLSALVSPAAAQVSVEEAQAKLQAKQHAAAQSGEPSTVSLLRQEVDRLTKENIQLHSDLEDARKQLAQYKASHPPASPAVATPAAFKDEDLIGMTLQQAENATGDKSPTLLSATTDGKVYELGKVLAEHRGGQFQNGPVTQTVKVWQVLVNSAGKIESFKTDIEHR